MENKKLDLERSSEPECLLDRILNRILNLKRNLEKDLEQENFEGSNLSSELPGPSPITIISTNNDSNGENEDSKTQINTKNSKNERLLPQDLCRLSEHLKDLKDYITETTEVLYLTYQYPMNLKKQVWKETTDLACLQREIQASAVEIMRLKRDKKAIRKEIHSNQKALAKLKRMELEELEKIIMNDDKSISERWKRVKDSPNAEEAENCLQEIKDKRNSLDALEMLILRKLNKQGGEKEELKGLNELMKNNSTDALIKQSEKICKHSCNGQEQNNKERISLGNDSTGTSDEGSEEVSTSSLPEADTTIPAISISSPSDIIQLNTTTVTFSDDIQNTIRLPSMDHPIIRERLAFRNSATQNVFNFLQSNTQEIELSPLFGLEPEINS